MVRQNNRPPADDPPGAFSGAPIGAPSLYPRKPLAAAAAVVAAVVVVGIAAATAAIAEQQHQNDDPPPVVIQAAAQTVIIVAHKITSGFFEDFVGFAAHTPCYSPGQKRCGNAFALPQNIFTELSAHPPERSCLRSFHPSS